MIASLLAADDGIFTGKANLADIFFLIAAIVFGIAAVIAYQVKTMYAVLLSVGLTCVALGWLVL
jgi:hypothetical protein